MEMSELKQSELNKVDSNEPDNTKTTLIPQIENILLNSVKKKKPPRRQSKKQPKKQSSTEQQEDQQPEPEIESLPQEPDIASENLSGVTEKDIVVTGKDIVVTFSETTKFRRFLNKMYNKKTISFLVAILITVLITFALTKYGNVSKPSTCVQDKDTLQPKKSFKAASEFHHLPTDIIPINYDLKIQPFLEPDQFYFNGTVLILVNCKMSTNIIKLNANELEIDSQKITIFKNEMNLKRTEFKLIKFTFENEVLTLELDKKLNENENYSIFIPFKGNLTNSLAGFYRSSYIDPESEETRYLAMTQFQATDARRAFPCFDEPAFKATFDVEIIHPVDLVAIANMPLLSQENIRRTNWIKSKFNRTVKMSTYLVAFAVGDFAFLKDESDEPIYRIATRPSEIASAKDALSYGPKILRHYEDYFKIKFPLPKIDMLATPDFSAGAMENWGLITYRETSLLFNPKLGSVVQKYRISSVIAHELAHQWFGNLVTPNFWNDLWLNEGFATYMSYEGVNSIKPGWKVWDRFVIDEIQDVLSLDALKNSHPISQKVNDPNEISELFDHISYAKGASIIRMMTFIIGKKSFKEGLHNYLNAFKYSNADQSDLWRHLQEASDKNNQMSTHRINVKEVMDSWTLKEGFPLITVTRDYESNLARFSQQRFVLNSHDKDRQMLLRTQYEVPITYTTSKELNWNPQTRLWLHNMNDSESYKFEEVNITNDDWLIVNVQQTGYYRVNYDTKNWKLLISQLLSDHSKIHRVNRGQILNDLFHLAENGVVRYKLALKALEYFKYEKDPLPWTSIGQLTYLINRMLRRTENYGKWQEFVKKLIEPAYKRFELNRIDDEDNLQDHQMQKTIASIACYYYLDSCVKKATELFNQLMQNHKLGKKVENYIPPNIRQVVYCTAIHHGKESEWDFVFQLYLKEQNANEKHALLGALTCSRIPWILNRYLKWMFEEKSGIRAQDGVFVFKGVSAQNYGKDIAFNFLRENWEKFYNVHGKQMSFAHIVKTLDSINSEFELNLVKQFYRTVGNRVGSAKRAFLQTIEQIEANILWMQKYEQEIADYLNQFFHKETV